MDGQDEARVLVIYTGGTIGMMKEKNGSYLPTKGFLSANLRSQTRFNDPTQSSLFANSSTLSEFNTWTRTEAIRATTSGHASPIQQPISQSFLKVALKTDSTQPKTESTLLPSLILPRNGRKKIEYAILEFENLIDSSEVSIVDFIEIAATIERNYHLFDAFVVLHGTDTMAYSASALSFLLENLGKTVIFTGAQIPLSELLNDSVGNFLSALIIAGNYVIPEVTIFFDSKLYRGNRCIKFSSTEFSAFSSPNFECLAKVGTKIEVYWSRILRPGILPFRAHTQLSDKVATLRIFPGISGAAIRAFLNADEIKGIVLETFGAGNAPKREELISALSEASQRGVVIVNVTQCTIGVVQSIYDTGLGASAGVSGGSDMTTEAALAKLSYLLSKPELSIAQIRELICKPIRGELTAPIEEVNYSAPINPADRIHHLFNLVRSSATLQVSSRPDPSVTLPTGFEEEWPASIADVEEAENSIRPFLIGQAAARDDTQLAKLLKYLQLPSSANTAIEGISDFCNSSNQTALHISIINATQNYILLLENGANVHIRDIFNHTALFYAANSHQLKTVEDLKRVGAHLGETEITRGDVGLSIFRSEKAGTEAAWRLACGEEDYERAKKVVLALLG